MPPPRLPEIDYANHWRSALAEAESAIEKLRASERSTHTFSPPKVFIYNLPAELSEGWDPESATVEEVFGPTLRSKRIWTNASLAKSKTDRTAPVAWWHRLSSERRSVMAEHVRDTNHYGFARAFVFRLWKSRRYRTFDPAKADLFLVPMLPLPKRGKFITSACERISDSKVAAALFPHFTEATAHKHFFLMAKEHYEGSQCPGWWANPTGLFRKAQRLSYSTVQPDSIRADDYYEYERKTHGPPKCNDLWHHDGCPDYPNMADAPYLGNVHWPPDAATSSSNVQLPPWADDGALRPYLSVFLGGFSHGDTLVRRRMGTMCKGYADTRTCLIQRYDFSTLLLKHLSTFCLEPGGDSPFRRSITDSVAFGCIPVFFSGAQDEAYSWLWGGWRRAASVSVNRTLFLNGQIDLRKLLGSAPPKLVSLMRRTLAERARAFTVSLEDDPMDSHASGDQVDSYLAYLLHRVAPNEGR